MFVNNGSMSNESTDRRGIPQPPPLLPARLPLMRPKTGRVLSGVCKGVSLHLGIGVTPVRLVTVLLALTGIGILPYLFLWVFVPQGDPTGFLGMQNPAQAPLARGNTAPSGRAVPQDPIQSPPSNEPSDLRQSLNAVSKPQLIAALGAALILLGLFQLLIGVKESMILPAMLFCGGIILAWLRFEDSEPHLPTLLISLGLIVGGITVYVFNSFPVQEAISIMAVAGILLLGIAATAAPWINSLIQKLSTERAMKEREEERADMTAHLHDGVLQTLALVQLHADEPQTVLALARSQERDLRNWLYQDRTPSDRSVGAGLKQIAAHVEDESGKPVEVVIVGDAQPSAQTDALLDATRQALVNAVTHGEEPISVYCESGREKVEVFVRDHGPGFNLDEIPPDRLGIKESIIGRVRRRGGTVEIVSRSGWGTEVRMHMPLSPAGQQDGRGQAHG